MKQQGLGTIREPAYKSTPSVIRFVYILTFTFWISDTININETQFLKYVTENVSLKVG